MSMIPSPENEQVATGPVSLDPADVTVPAPRSALTHAVYQPITTDPTPAPSSVPAPVYHDETDVDPTDLHVTDADKLDYIYQTLKKLGSLLDSVTPDQMDRVTKLASNPLFGRMFGGK